MIPEIEILDIRPPEVFLNVAPKAGIVVPDANEPSALSFAEVVPILNTAPELDVPSVTTGFNT